MMSDDQEVGSGRRRIGSGITLGNFISPAITVVVLGLPGLIWGGKIDSQVTNLVTEISQVKSTSQQTSATIVGISYTISEGLKQTMTDLTRRVTNLEDRVDRLSDENRKLQLDLATIKRASESPGAR